MGGNISNPFPDSLVQETLYHGSVSADITEFNTSGPASNGAIFFTDFEEQAEMEPYGKYWAEGNNPTMYEVKLDIRNPLRVEVTQETMYDPKAERVQINRAKRNGYDAVIFHERWSDTTNYAVFDSKQVKIMNKRKISPFPI